MDLAYRGQVEREEGGSDLLEFAMFSIVFNYFLRLGKMVPEVNGGEIRRGRGKTANNNNNLKSFTRGSAREKFYYYPGIKLFVFGSLLPYWLHSSRG